MYSNVHNKVYSDERAIHAVVGAGVRVTGAVPPKGSVTSKSKHAPLPEGSTSNIESVWIPSDQDIKNCLYSVSRPHSASVRDLASWSALTSSANTGARTDTRGMYVGIPIYI